LRRILGASISELGLKVIAAVCMISYVVSKTIIQKGLLNIDSYNSDTLLQAMAGGSFVMSLSTLAVLMELLAGLALTLYAFMLVEGFVHTEKFSSYMVNLVIFSLVSEVAYDYCFYGEMFYFKAQNPMIALLIGLIMLYSFRLIQTGMGKHYVKLAVVFLASIAWCLILRVEFGLVTVLLVAIYYLFREKKGLKLALGFFAGLPYITGFLAIYPLFIYDGKRGKTGNKYFYYLFYPLIMLICALSVAAIGPKEVSIVLGDADKVEVTEGTTETSSEEFIKGMDVSSVLAEEKAGVIYRNEKGDEEDVFKILRDSGLNYVRIRVWNDPFDSNGNGYGGGNNDVRTAAILGKRAADYDMESCIDFHYSDFWADPSKQMSPKEWENLDFDEKIVRIYDFTYKSLEEIDKAGADIGMVQIGNEINNGMAGYKDINQVIMLLKSASKAVRDFDKDIQIAVHYTDIQHGQEILKISEKLQQEELDYDIFGVSYYPYWHGTLEDMKGLLTDISDKYGKKTCILETSYVYTDEDMDGFANSISGGEPVAGYPASIEGQENLIRDIMTSAYDAKAVGVFYWEGCWVAVSDSYKNNKDLYESSGAGWASSYAAEYDSKDAGRYYGGCSWDNQAMFDSGAKALPSLSVFKLELPKD